MDAFELEITELSPAESARIWKRQTKRAPNFDAYRMYLNTHSVGHSWNVAVPQDTVNVSTPPKDSKEGATFQMSDGRTATLRKMRDGTLAWRAVSVHNDEYVKAIKHNFNEAAKERTTFEDVTATVQAAGFAGKSGDTYNLPDGRVASLGTDGKWTAETLSPVVIRYKANAHKETRNVVEGQRKSTAEISVVDSLTLLIVASEAVQTRGPKTATEDVSALVTNPPAGAKKGAKVDLPDGRKATLTAAGKWRAPKAETPATTTDNAKAETTDNAINGFAGTDSPLTNGAAGLPIVPPVGATA